MQRIETVYLLHIVSRKLHIEMPIAFHDSNFEVQSLCTNVCKFGSCHKADIDSQLELPVDL